VGDNDKQQSRITEQCSGSPDNFRYVLSSRTRGTNVLSGKPQGLVFSQKVTKMIKHRDDKGRTYDVIPLDWGINNFDVYNRNGLIETVILYTCIIFYLILKFKQ
jgi:hypothetical protein